MLYVVLGTKREYDSYVLDCTGRWPASSQILATTW